MKLPFLKHNRRLFKFLSSIERRVAYMQGKGFGSFSIKEEVDCLLPFAGSCPSLAVDIGANVGDYTSELRTRCPHLEIHAFEPAETNLNRLHERFSRDDRVHIVPGALSDTTGDATLYSNVAGSGLGSLTQRKLDHRGISFGIKESVSTHRFDDYWSNVLDGRCIDLAKIDVEGHELSVLKGFGKAIEATRVLQFEFGGCNIDTHSFFQDYWFFFRDLGFSIYRITPFGINKIAKYREADEYFVTTNYVAVNERLI